MLLVKFAERYVPLHIYRCNIVWGRELGTTYYYGEKVKTIWPWRFFMQPFCTKAQVVLEYWSFHPPLRTGVITPTVLMLVGIIFTPLHAWLRRSVNPPPRSLWSPNNIPELPYSAISSQSHYHPSCAAKSPCCMFLQHIVATTLWEIWYQPSQIGPGRKRFSSDSLWGALTKPFRTAMKRTTYSHVQIIFFERQPTLCPTPSSLTPTLDKRQLRISSCSTIQDYLWCIRARGSKPRISNVYTSIHTVIAHFDGWYHIKSFSLQERSGLVIPARNKSFPRILS